MWKNKNMKKLTEKQAGEQLCGWTPALGIEKADPFSGQRFNAIGYNLAEREKIDKAIMEDLTKEYIYNKNIEFLSKIPKTGDNRSLLEAKKEYFDKYVFDSDWVLEEAMNNIDLEDRITEKTFLQFIAAKHGPAKMMAVKQIIS